MNPAGLSFTKAARRLGIVSGLWIAAATAAYAVTLALGMLRLRSPHDPIADPYFWLLELLIVLIAPALPLMFAALHAWSPQERRTGPLLAIAFATATATLTCAVHFLILAVSRRAEFAAWPEGALLLSFRWPSVAYAIDILAWDFFFPLTLLAAAWRLGGGPARAAQVTMIVSAMLALAGLGGVVASDMRIRNIGILGYVPGLVILSLLLARLFAATPASREE